MGLLEKVFKGSIDKAVSRKLTAYNSMLTSQQAMNYSNALNNMMAFINNSLPTVNPDGYDYTHSFRTIGAVYETTDLMCKKVIGSPYVFLKIKDKKKYLESKRLEVADPVQSYLLKLQATEEVDDSRLRALLDNPNNFQTGNQFTWTTALSYMLNGNTWMHGTMDGKRAIELYCFPNMEVQADMDDLLDPIRGYKLLNSNLTPFEKETIYHLKTGNPANIDRTMEYLYGVSPLRAYLEPMRTIREADKQSSKQIRNGGAFGLLSPENKEDLLKPEQKQQLHDKMVAAKISDEEMARIFVSTIAMQWQNIGLASADLQLLEAKKASWLDVYRAYHVPPQYYDASSGTFNNQSTAVKQFIYDCVAPYCDAIGEALTRFLGPGYDNVIIKLDYTQLQEMAVNMKEVSDYIIPLAQAGLITPDEARLALKYGETNLDFMKEYYMSSAVTTRRRVFDGSNQTPPITTQSS